MERHFTTTVFVVRSDGRILLLWHKKFQKWMPPGGHLDPDELPEDSAARECKEETGIDVEIVDAPAPPSWHKPTIRVLKHPMSMCLADIPAFAGGGGKEAYEAHQHMNLAYLGKPRDEKQELVAQESETDGVRWFSADEIRRLPDTDIFSSVRAECLGIAGIA